MKYAKSYGYLAIAMLLFLLCLQILYQPTYLQTQFPMIPENTLMMINGLIFCVSLFGSWFLSDKALKNLGKTNP